jgi:L-alanine-DL-glutamate epimerase-like enolase superfamily enzyme
VGEARVGGPTDLYLRSEEGGFVKVTAVETFRVPPRWLFCKISTHEGLVGWGEPVVEGRAGTVQAAVDELSDYLIGSIHCASRTPGRC